MMLMDLYAPVLSAHITMVALSGILFTARGLGVMAGSAWAMSPGVRRVSVLIDSALLAAALLLLHLLQLKPWAVSWLAMKMGLLLVYVVLGSFALKRAKSPVSRRICFVAALLCFGFMVTVALAHNPLGLFLWI